MLLQWRFSAKSASMFQATLLSHLFNHYLPLNETSREFTSCWLFITQTGERYKVKLPCLDQGNLSDNFAAARARLNGVLKRLLRICRTNITGHLTRGLSMDRFYGMDQTNSTSTACKCTPNLWSDWCKPMGSPWQQNLAAARICGNSWRVSRS